MVSRLVFYHLKRRGILVFYWVLNNEKEFQEAIRVMIFKYFLFQDGVHGIMTDSPTLLKRYLQMKNLVIKQE
jgi:glycerophosphoryl diester phosphodiesterase